MTLGTQQIATLNTFVIKDTNQGQKKEGGNMVRPERASVRDFS